KDGYVFQVDSVFLDFLSRTRWAEVILLAQDLARWAVCRWRPAQDEFLRARLVHFSKYQTDASEPLRVVEQQADCLFSGTLRAPFCCGIRQERTFDRVLLVFRRDFDLGQRFQIEPALIRCLARFLWLRTDSFSHSCLPTKSSLSNFDRPVGAPSLIVEEPL